jgi:DNA recombination protein Rad52
MIGFTDEQKAALSAKLDAAHVKKRQQAGRDLSYIEGWHAIAEANRIFGFDGWTRETVDCRMVAERERKVGQGDGWGVSYVARARVTVGNLVREGIGAGHGIDRDLGLAHESAIKEAETDAMKRALMTFGNPFGLALYDKTQEHVEKPEPAKPAAPPPKPAAPAADAFWQRPSYELKGSNVPDLGAFAKAFEGACKKAPTLDALLKLEQDNADHLAALGNAHTALFKQARNVLATAQLRFNEKAA